MEILDFGIGLMQIKIDLGIFRLLPFYEFDLSRELLYLLLFLLHEQQDELWLWHERKPELLFELCLSHFQDNDMIPMKKL